MAVRPSLSDCLSIELESPFVEVGMDISGSVLLRLSESVPATHLYIAFAGKESFYYTEPAFRRQMKPWGYNFDLVKTKLVNERAEVVSFPDGVAQAGNYQFPFRVDTSASLPASIHCELNLSHLQISYKLTALLSGANVQRSAPVYLYRPVKQSLPPNEVSVSLPLSSCCLSKGFTQVALSLATEGFRTGDTVDLGVMVDNRGGTLPVQRVKGTLWEVYLMQGKRKHFGAKVIDEGEMGTVVMPGKALIGKDALSMKLRVKSECQSTAKGAVVQCMHRVTVAVMVAGHWQPTTLEKTIDIAASLPATQASFSISPSWDLQTYPVTEISINSPMTAPLLP